MTGSGWPASQPIAKQIGGTTFGTDIACMTGGPADLLLSVASTASKLLPSVAELVDGASGRSGTLGKVKIVLRTRTPDGIDVVLSAIVYAKILEEHAAVADLALIGRTIRRPDQRRPDVRPNRERFFRHDGRLWVLSVVEFGAVPAIIVTVFSAVGPLS